MGVVGGRWKGRQPDSTALPSVMIVIVSKCVRVGQRSFGDRQNYVQVRGALWSPAFIVAPFLTTHNIYKRGEARHACTRC